ncbi:MAG: PQQ-binding-like beta-propeller repeat protein [Gemmataceae bacterium]
MRSFPFVALIFTSTSWAAAPCPPSPLGHHRGGVASVHFSPDGQLVASGGGDKTIRITEIASGKVLHSWPGPSSFTCVVRFSPDGKTLAAAGYEAGSTNAIYRFDLTTGKELPRLCGPLSGGVRRLVFSPDGKRLISAGFDGYVRIWDLLSGKADSAFRVDSGTVYGLALSPDGKLLATAAREGLRLWDAKDGRALLRPQMSKQEAVAVCFSPDGKLVASGDSSSVVLWEVVTGKPARTLEGFKGELSALLFSPDGRTLYTASYDKMIRIWDVRSGHSLGQVEAHTGWIWALDLRRDGRQLVSGSVDGQLKLWSTCALRSATAHRSAKVSAVDVEQRWKDLAHPEASVAMRAVWELASDPAQSLPLLSAKLAKVRGEGPSLQEIHRLIADLDHEEWPVRERASQRLLAVGPHALASIKAALERPVSPEAARRLARLVHRIDPTALPAEDLLVLRGVQVLENIGTPEAQRILHALAQDRNGTPRLVEEATLAVQRLARSLPSR